MSRNASIRNIFVALHHILVGENVRLPTLYAVEAMASSIQQKGIETPLTAWQPVKNSDTFELLRGHRRYAGLTLFRQRDPEGFQTMFPKGIPVEFRVGIDAKEAASLKVDHGNVLALSHPHEVQMAASMLLDAGCTEGEVANSLRGLFETQSPMRGKNLLRVQALEAKLDGATPLEAVEIEGAISKVVKDYHRGRVQILKTVWRCPVIVSQARFYRACGVRPDGVDATVYLPTISTADAKTLEKAFLKDQADKDARTGVSRYSKRLPGPNFTSAWEAVCLKDQEATTPDARAKALSGKVIRESAGAYNSVGFRAVCGLHCGDSPEAGAAVKEADELLYRAELVSKHEPELWSAVLEATKVIEQRIMAEARAEAEARAQAEGVILDKDTGEVIAKVSSD